MRVTLLFTCMVDLFEPDVGKAAVRVLRAAGCDVSCPLGQTCCGQPAWNAGFAEDAARVARTMLQALEDDLAAGSEAVVVPAGSCATMVKVFWPELFEVAGDHHLVERARRVGERTHEFASFVEGRPVVGLSPRAATIAYHHSCHMLRELRISTAPEALAKTAGATVADWRDATRCCGFGGLFSMKLPETSIEMADSKIESLPNEATVLIGCDASCLMHLRARAEHEGRPLATQHLAQFLSERLGQ